MLLGWSRRLCRFGAGRGVGGSVVRGVAEAGVGSSVRLGVGRGEGVGEAGVGGSVGLGVALDVCCGVVEAGEGGSL